MVISGSAQLMPLEKALLAQTKTKPTSLGSLSADSTLNRSLQAGVNTVAIDAQSRTSSVLGATSIGEAASIFSGALAKRKASVTYVWAIPGVASNNIAPSSLPVFQVNFAAVPGANPDDYEPAIIKLTPIQNANRVLGATEGKVDASQSAASDWQLYSSFLEDRVGLNSKKTGRGQFEISPATPLLPGEYSIVLRPISRTKKFSGADIARNQGDGMIFNAVWSFQVPIDARAQ
jgi:hypothetical protein